eukprot:CAMPEP_0206144378 /NCGR_PEP_ID=MMETSP1473-20131121/23916_1 /ASSEMBLY_ACC=CAM_ASM_001109 /TAXON_ID=1461547 /ORGANISM="Stichococcus sp, Strain RCC1054" /LENGTH=58 /DNA_ID=CAMNT_0053540191 /DNA_START=8 /DNA_END=184 /DNA_ORIENTATION=+
MPPGGPPMGGKGPPGPPMPMSLKPPRIPPPPPPPCHPRLPSSIVRSLQGGVNHEAVIQ